MLCFGAGSPGFSGMATTYAETFLCHHFRYQGHGGSMYILHFLLHKKTLALLYSAALTLSAFFIGCTTQSNAITETCHQVFSLPPATCAIITAFFVGLILMQGRKWIENVSIAIVPTMAIFFFGGCLLYLILHSDYLLPSEINFFLRFCAAFRRWRFCRIHDGKSHPLWRGKGSFYKRIRAWHNWLIAGHCSEDDSVNRPPFPCPLPFGTPSFSAPSPDLYLSAISWNFRPNGRRFRLRLNDSRIWKTSIFR